ncbi:facilitated trehalose transporter Tret1-like [Aphomia sociella]
MDSQYKQVNVNEVQTEDDILNGDDEKFCLKLFLRQLLVSSGTWTVFFICGLYMAAPTVYLPHLRRQSNSTIVTDEMASWISSGSSYGSIPWIFIISAAVSIFGRKTTSAAVYIYITFISVLFYFSNTPNQLLAFQISLGVPYAAAMTVSILILSEYTSPKYRGMFLTMKTATLYWGIWISNAIGTCFHWKYISVFGFICSLYNLTVFLWPESPFWLASEGRFEDCKKSHRWLKGISKKAESELATLIDTYKNVDCPTEKTKIVNFLLNIIKTLVIKEFYRPVLLSFLCAALYNLSGKIVYSIYAVEMIRKITDNESTAYVAMLILDGVTVFSMYFGCFLVKILKRRTLLFISSSIAITFLFTLSLYLYLVKLNIFSENTIVSVLLLVGFSLSISCGPILMAVSLYGELLPTKHKTLSSIVISLFFTILQSTLLKNAPFIFKHLKMHGMFLFFGISMCACLCLLYKYLPETKDKTLQEIEDYFKGDKLKTGKK